MAFRAPHSRERPPKCFDCGSGSPNVVSFGEDRHDWLCAPCEYRRAFPDAKPVPLAPSQRKPLPLQTETLI